MKREPLFWLEVAATLGSLIGGAGLIAMLYQDARAADTRQGFTPGGKSFNNPFANAAVAGGGTANPPTPPPPSGGNPTAGNFFDDEEEDGFQNNPGGGFPPPGAPDTGLGAGGPGTSGGRPSSAVQVGGGPPSGVVAHSTVPPLSIDDETGAGSREVVTDFNFPDADIMDIAKALGKLTGKNFILDKDVKGRVTIISNSPITVGDAWRAFLTALDMSGFGLIPSGKYIRVARQRDARDKQLKTYTGDYSPDTDALITRVFPLKYIQAEEVARTFRSFMPANSRIIPYEQTNTVIVTDTGSNIAKLGKMLEILDVEGYDAGIEVIPVRYASAVELAKLIDNLIPGTPAAGAGQPPGAGRFGGGRFTARRTKEGGIINTIIADERTNTLIVHANGKGADQVRELVAKLDLNKPAAAGGKVHVVYLQFADAESVANTLNNISSAKLGPAPTATGSGATGTGTNPVGQSLFEGSIKIAPDKSTNALVVTASPADFVTVERVINRLDIPRDEVYVEVIVMEVSLQNAFNWSSNVASPAAHPPVGFVTNQNDVTSLLSPNPFSTNGAILAFGGGGTQTIQFNGTSVTVPNVLGLIKFLQSNTNANVLATPQIVALDNTDALFESTENLPVLTSTAVQGAGVSQSVSKQSVPLSIKLTPSINKLSNYVKLKLESKISAIEDRVLPSAVQNQALATLDRAVNTTVVVGDSDTAVIGGLTRDQVSTTITKIPILGDIPLLGWLFKAKTDTVTKSNLLIFMTPHIVRQYEKIRALLDQKLKERDEFIESEVGGEDRLRYYRDKMIRSLPDIKDITKKAETTVTLDEDGEEQPTQTDPFTGGKKPVMTDKGHPLSNGATTPPAAVAVPPTPGTVPPIGTPPPSDGFSPAPFDPNIIPPPPTTPFVEGTPPN